MPRRLAEKSAWGKNPENIPKEKAMGVFDGFSKKTGKKNILEIMGHPGISAVGAQYIKIAMTNEDTFIAFSDFSVEGKLSVMKFAAEGTWQLVGPAGISDEKVEYLSIAIIDGSPCVAYCDTAAGGKPTVKKYDTTNGWSVVGERGFYDEPSYHDYISLAAYQNKACVGFVSDASGVPLVMKHDGNTAWNKTGKIDDWSAEQTFIAANKKDLFICYRTEEYHSVRVLKYDGASWMLINDPDAFGHLDFHGLYPKIFCHDDDLYLVFQKGASIFVYAYSNGAWEDLCLPAVECLNIFEMPLAVAGNTLYLAFSDFGDGGKISVLKFNLDAKKWMKMNTKDISKNEAQYVTIGGNETTAVIAFQDLSVGGRASAIRITAE